MFREAMKKNILLQQEYVELESSYNMESENYKNTLAEAIKKQKWVTTMYERQRQINESLCNESDQRTHELQKQLDDLKEQNAALLKTKDKVVVSAFRHQAASDSYRLTVKKLEHENNHLRKELKELRVKLNEKSEAAKETRRSADSNSDGDESVSERKDSKQKGNTELSTEQNSSSSGSDQFSNRRHRLRLCRVIQEGFQKLRDKK